MSKLNLDKYYTPLHIVRKCIDRTFDVIGEENISSIIEPSAGNGAFSLLMKDVIAYDIEPEHDSIIKQDFLKLDLEYQKGRLVIGNPPYGRCLSLAQKFYKKSITLGDYVAFVLPISQYNNNITFFEFDLIYSEDLGKQLYTGVNLHCCFNIYKRNSNGGLNQKVSNKLKDITIIRQDSKSYSEIPFDIRMCYWGDGSAGKILKGDEKYSGEYKIVINNNELKNDIIRVLTMVDWREELNKIAMLRIKQYDVYNVLKKYIPSIK